jgi:transposase
MEGINSRIQEIKRRARGFRNIDNFIAMIYLEAANLDFALPT